MEEGDGGRTGRRGWERGRGREIVEIAERRGKAIMLLSPMYKNRSWYYKSK